MSSTDVGAFFGQKMKEANMLEEIFSKAENHSIIEELEGISDVKYGMGLELTPAELMEHEVAREVLNGICEQ